MVYLGLIDIRVCFREQQDCGTFLYLPLPHVVCRCVCVCVYACVRTHKHIRACARVCGCVVAACRAPQHGYCALWVT